MKKNQTKPLLYLLLTVLNLSTLFANENSNEKTIHIQVPQVISVPQVNVKIIQPINIQTKNENVIGQDTKTMNRRIGFSKRTPPSYITKNVSTHQEKVSTFFRQDALPVETIKDRLQKNGFEILAKYKIDKKGSVVSIVFTDANITTQASQKDRGFASSLRVLVNEKNHTMSITNPLYIMKAFMQDKYDEKVARNVVNKLHKAFDGLKKSEDSVKFSKLDHYRFMDNMPYYKDMEVVASRSNNELIESARRSKNIIYEQKLSNGSIIIGVKLSRRTSKFVKKIGYQNAGLLPYPILIEGNKARILSPQYYIALMYPMLNMTQFMSIASIPGAIVKDCTRIFKK
ncbi:MAG: hypothetical protein Q9M34_02885 [Sulfurimonas sp.]|nr:hypothetical protein [Sulfurimonas sp.]